MADSAVVIRAAAAASSAFRRRFPIGAEPLGDGRMHVRLWAPLVGRVECVGSARGEQRTTALAREQDGYFSAAIGGRSGAPSPFRLHCAGSLAPRTGPRLS